MRWPTADPLQLRLPARAVSPPTRPFQLAASVGPLGRPQFPLSCGIFQAAPDGFVPDRDAAGFADARGAVPVPCAGGLAAPGGVPGRRGERRVRADLAAPGRLRPVGVAVFDAAGGPPLSLTRAVPPRVRRTVPALRPPEATAWTAGTTLQRPPGGVSPSPPAPRSSS